jgi:N-acetylglucosaminyldiphosphoundecaprenol N-acetyl-beta-D-mannosaminyltransferase
MILMTFDNVKILEIPVFSGSIKDASAVILNDIERNPKESRCISLTGAHGLVYSKKNPGFKETLKSFYINLPDGMPGVWIGKFKGRKKMERCYGPDLFMEVIKSTADKDIKHFLCGGKEGVAAELKEVCIEKFNNPNIAGTYSPPFREMTDEEFAKLGEKINSTGADIVWIGISTPKQELFAKRLSRFTKVHFIITVGAAFDFHTKKIKQAPEIFQKMGLEWFFRLMIEPKRLWKRYAEVVPSFIFFNFAELVKGKFFK